MLPISPWMRAGLCGLLLVVMVGCRAQDGSMPPAPVECEISGLNTSYFVGGLTGDQVNVRWTQNGVPATVLIELLMGTTVVDTIALEAANDGFYPWEADTGGQVGGGDFGIRVTGNGAAGCTAEIGDLTIVDVNGCGMVFTSALDSLVAGQTIDVMWDNAHTSGQVDLELWTTAFGELLGERVGIIGAGVPNTGSYSWTVDSFHRGTYSFYRYVVRDTAVPVCADTSGTFAIYDPDVCSITVTGVGPSVPLAVGSQVVLMLDQVNGSGTVNLRLYAGNTFVAGGFIADNVSLLNPFVWTVDDFGYQLANNKYHIKVIDAADGYCTGISDRFTIMVP